MNWLALAGGLLIGAAAMLLLYFNGRVAGISGITWGAFANRDDRAWRWFFLLGLVLGPLLFHGASGVALPAPNDALDGPGKGAGCAGALQATWRGGTPTRGTRSARSVLGAARAGVDDSSTK